ncbi:MAG: antibiotic biosynthesis monooxygenase [Hyphomicrobiales bacterium]|nr:antibiotic biosynthesis monooxygenase [Hyphomicrobiales bacterium]
MAVKRIWHGWTTPDNADTYEHLLHDHVFPGIEDKEIPGYRGIELLRRDGADEVEFVTIMTFESLDDVIAFQGPDYARCYVPDAAQKVLKRWDQVAAHYELREQRQYG